MHYIRRHGFGGVFYLACYFFVLSFLLFIVTLALGIRAWWLQSFDSLTLFAIAFAITIIVWLLNWMLSGSSRCQLCQVPLLRSLKCTHSPEARKLFGSYRLQMSVVTLSTRSFRCPFCGESFTLRKHPDINGKELNSPTVRTVRAKTMRSRRPPPRKRQ